MSRGKSNAEWPRLSAAGQAMVAILANRHGPHNPALVADIAKRTGEGTIASGRRRSELQRRPQRETLHSAAHRPGGHDALAIDVVGLELDVRRPVPVQPDRVFAVRPALDRVVVQVQVAVAVYDLPRA